MTEQTVNDDALSRTMNVFVKELKGIPVSLMATLGSGFMVYGGTPPVGSRTGASTVTVASSPRVTNANPSLQFPARPGHYTNNGPNTGLDGV